MDDFADVTDDWCLHIQNALATTTLDERQLYAGDDRRRFARLDNARGGRVRKAAVLIPIVAAATPHIILTERSHALRSHPGQISFPGGSVEARDANPAATAVRESREEIGLEPAHVRMIGRLPDYVTGTGFDVAPFVARVATDATVMPDGNEVARILTVPLAHVLDTGNFRRESIPINGIDYQFHIIEYNGDYIWGATAAMLHALSSATAST